MVLITSSAELCLKNPESILPWLVISGTFSFLSASSIFYIKGNLRKEP